MFFGGRRAKLDVVADFIEALGASAFRLGDAFGMTAFAAVLHTDLYYPALRHRGIGSVMAAALRQFDGGGAGVTGLIDALQPLSGRPGLIFLVSDFHWPLAVLDEALDLLAHACVVPVIVWDPAEIEPPSGNGFVTLRDAESGRQRTLWLGPRLRRQWQDAVAERRQAIEHLLSARGIRPFFMHGHFDGEALSQYFFEADA
jgi:hypothetical protein